MANIINPYASFVSELLNLIAQRLDAIPDDALVAKLRGVDPLHIKSPIAALEELASTLPASKVKRKYARRAGVRENKEATGGRKRINYSAEQKAEALKLYQTGMPVLDICDRVGFKHQSILYGVIKAAGIPKRSRMPMPV